MLLKKLKIFFKRNKFIDKYGLFPTKFCAYCGLIDLSMNYKCRLCGSEEWTLHKDTRKYYIEE